MRARTAAARASRGLSLVEVLVGLVIGLFIAAAGATLLAAQWREHRSTTVEMRLMQELRGTTELIVRDLRRAGHWGDAAAGLWAASAAAPPGNPYAALAPAGAASNAAAFGYSRDTSENHLLDANEQFGLRLRRGVIELQLGAGNWQALTDPGTMVVDELRITPALREVPLLDHCPRACPPGATCAAAVLLRSFALQIAVHAAGDAGVRRRLHGDVRVRNDALLGACPA